MQLVSSPNHFIVFNYSLCWKLLWADCSRALHRRAAQEGLGTVMFLCLSCCLLSELHGRQKFCPPHDIAPFVLIFPGSLHTLCSMPKPSLTLPLKKIVIDQQCHSKWQSLHTWSHLHGQELHSSTGRCTSMKKELPGALQHRELHIEQGNETPLLKPDCFLQMRWNTKVISKNIKRE